jgi:hypothetical protein
MNNLHLAMTLLMVVGCGSGSSNSPGLSLESRSRMFMSGGRILDVRVTGDGSPYVIENIGVTAQGTAWPSSVNRQLISHGRYAAPAQVRVGLVSSHTRTETGTTLFNSAQFYGIGSLVNGTRYLVVEVSPQSDTSTGVLVSPQRVFRVDADGRLAEPALEFPAGTPVSTVMDPSTMPQHLLGDSDASAPGADAAMGGG